MKTVLDSTFSDRNVATAKSLLDNILPVMLLLLTLLIVFQFAFPVTEKFQYYITFANWGVMTYFAVRLAVDYRLAGPEEQFWRSHWMDILMVVPLFSIMQEARVAKVAEETIIGSEIGEKLIATSALRNSRAAAQITRIFRMLKRSL